MSTLNQKLKSAYHSVRIKCILHSIDMQSIVSDCCLMPSKQFSVISWQKKKLPFDEMVMISIYRLMHALFHIKTVIISRDRYRPEAFSPRVDISRGMITVLIWKKACINLFITYFNIELKRTKLTSHTDTKLMDVSDRYRLRVLLKK
jgi:hypothetical protein